MKILFFAPDHTNSTDGVIVQGTHNVLRSVFGEYEFDYLFFDRAEVIEEEKLNPNVKYDLVVITGTPWIWDQFNKSVKWKNLIKCFEVHKESKKLFMGIGSCLFPEAEYIDICERQEETDAFKEIYSQAVVIVRDQIAYNKLTKAGIKCELLVCPSYFCYGLDPIQPKETKQNVLIWYDPTMGLSRCGWTGKKLDDYIKLNQEFHIKYKPKVYTHLICEVEMAEKYGLGIPELIGGWKNTLKIMESANYVLSGRVHCSVPAFVQGKPVGLLQIDSRSHTLSDFGGTIITSINQFKTMGHNHRDFTLYLSKYQEILRKLI